MTSQNNALEIKKVVSNEPKQSTDIAKRNTELKPVVKLNNLDKKTIEILVSHFDMSEEEALLTIQEPNKWAEYKDSVKKYLDVQDLKNAKSLVSKVEEKIESGSLEQALKGITGEAIIRDKALNQDVKGPMFQIAGQQVRINVKFPFKPYQKLRVLEGETEE